MLGMEEKIRIYLSIMGVHPSKISGELVESLLPDPDEQWPTEKVMKTLMELKLAGSVGANNG